MVRLFECSSRCGAFDGAWILAGVALFLDAVKSCHWAFHPLSPLSPLFPTPQSSSSCVPSEFHKYGKFLFWVASRIPLITCFHVQAPRGLSAEEKRVRLLEIFHETVYKVHVCV